VRMMSLIGPLEASAMTDLEVRRSSSAEAMPTSSFPEIPTG
jgi:hypothetical protein